MNATSLTRPLRLARCMMEELREAARDGKLSPQERASAVESMMSAVSPETMDSFRRAMLAGSVSCWDMDGQTICDAIQLRMDAAAVYALDGDAALLAAMETVDAILDRESRTLVMALEEEFWYLIYLQSFEGMIPESNHWWGYRVGRDSQ